MSDITHEAASTAPPSSAVEVFYSYAHVDEEFRAELETHLRLLERQGVITGWHDCKITPGKRWDGEIDVHLESAEIILLLVSADFLASDYCYEKELMRAMERHASGEACVIPVILRACEWFSAPFGKLQALPKDARPIKSWPDRDEAYVNVVAGIKEAIGERQKVSAEELPLNGSVVTVQISENRIPYRGLRTFNEDDAPFFFGRSDDIKSLVVRLEQISFLAVIGASGSGKSSLVRAGLIPAVRRGALPNSGTWKIDTFTPGARPLESLAVGLSRLGSKEPRSKMIDNMLDDARELHLYIQFVMSECSADERALLVIDQFEEVFTLCNDEKERSSFLANLLAASSHQGRCIVLITMRADFYHRCLAYADLARKIADHQYVVVAMDDENLQQTIEEPAKRVRLTVEPGLVREILEEVRNQPGALPLLEHALYEVWKRRSEGRMTLHGYKESGGVKGAIASRAEAMKSRTKRGSAAGRVSGNG